MKRKRGYKKGKHDKHFHSASAVVAGGDDDGFFDKPAPGPGRVKVKLKSSSKPLEAHSDGQSSHLSIDDGANSLRNINIKPSSPPQHSGYTTEKELNTALQVITKIMKMDAAEPFNAPVDPVALGIPDYFDIIDTPMDFGTICNNLQRGHIYNTSQDVYKDVQYIWENCYKYNNKGDYIVDLMKRVKKNFIKYWTASGLYCDQLNRTNDAVFGQDSIELPLEDDHRRVKFEASGRMTPSLNASERHQVETSVPSSQEKGHTKGTSTKHKKRGRHGFNKHKNDCLCAVCVIRRRRKEREGNTKVMETQIEISDGNTSQEFKQEEMSENHFSEDASSNLDRSPYPGADADMEEQSEKMKYEKSERQGSLQEINREVEIHYMGGKDHSDQFLLGDGSEDDRNQQSRSEEMSDSLRMTQKYNSKEDTPPHWKEEAIEMQKLQQKHDSQMMQQQTILCKNLLLDRNPSVMKLCGTLFSNTRKSIWNGPHSVGHRDVPVHNTRSSIAVAVEMLMK